MTLPIPKAALDQHVIVLGKTRSGKSSKLRVIVEHLLEREEPVTIIDPKGDWWGLKSSVDGKSPGYPVVIFGGDHADVPINDQSGKYVAELVCTGNRPSIIDVSKMRVGERTRFFIDFAETMFLVSKGTRYLVVDEAHNFAPQGKVLNPQIGEMLHWANRLASEGQGRGIILLAASQRPQKVHKDFLTSCETLIACRVIHKLDRDAIKDWIDGCADPAVGKDVIASLASMARPEAWCWSPEIDFGPKRITFPLFGTYDSFKPQAARTGRLKGWADVDLTEVKAKLASVIEEAKANDPAALRREIAELKRELAQKPSADPVSMIEAGKRHGEILQQRDAAIDERDEARDRNVRLLDEIIFARNTIHGAVEKLSQMEESLTAVEKGADGGRTRAQRYLEPPARPPTVPAKASGTRALQGGVRTAARGLAVEGDRPWTSLSGNEALYGAICAQPTATAREQSTLAGLKPGGSTASTYFTRMKTAGHIVANGYGGWKPEKEAIRLMFRPTLAGVLARWTDLGGGPMKIVNTVADRGTTSRAEVAAALGVDASGSTFSTYLTRARSAGLVTTDRETISLAPILQTL